MKAEITYDIFYWLQVILKYLVPILAGVGPALVIAAILKYREKNWLWYLAAASVLLTFAGAFVQARMPGGTIYVTFV